MLWQHLVDRIDRIDERVLGAVARSLPDASLRAAAETLRALRQGFENEARWRDKLVFPNVRSTM